MEVVHRREREIDKLAGHGDPKTRRDARDVSIEVIAIDFPRQVARERRRIAASGEVAYDEDSEIARRSGFGSEPLVRRESQENLGTLITHRSAAS